MADQTPGEANVQRDGAQLNVREAREVAADRGTVRAPASDGHADREILEAPVGPNIATSNTPDEPAPDQRPFTDSETALGGADAVQKTTWGVGHGTEPDGREEHAPVGLKKGEGDVVARVSAGGGVSPIVWVVGILAVLALLVYSFGIFRH